MFKITWNSNSRRAESLQDVEQVLDTIHAASKEDPILVTVEIEESGDSLAIGLGADLSVLNYVAGTRNPPYFTSKGSQDGDRVLSYRFGGDVSEFPVRNGIPVALARKAAKHFCQTGERIAEVHWEED